MRVIVVQIMQEVLVSVAIEALEVEAILSTVAAVRTLIETVVCILAIYDL